jgi:IS30 family transposase
MGQHYKQLALEERIEIYRLHAEGLSCRAIGALLGRSAGTISREMRRNSATTKLWKGGYEPVRAAELTTRRRARGRAHKLAQEPKLQAYVHERLLRGWSPEQIAGILALEQGKRIISHESIYRFIYHRSARKDYWHRLLPQRKSRRGMPGVRGGSPVRTIKYRTSIHERPPYVQSRAIAGHWEADLMLFATYGQAVLVAHERSSRLLRLTQQPSKAAQPAVDSLKAILAAVPQALRRSVTFDNGTEFAYHYQLSELNIKTYFCDPHKPWQKGGVENAIRRMRRSLPRKTNLANLSPNQLHAFTEAYNNTPRKCLNYLTPNQAFAIACNSVALET